MNYLKYNEFTEVIIMGWGPDSMVLMLFKEFNLMLMIVPIVIVPIVVVRHNRLITFDRWF